MTKRLFWLTSRLGDVICGIPTFRALRAKYPDDVLGWAVAPEYRGVIPKCADVVISPEQIVKSEWNQIFDCHPWHFHGDWAREKIPLPTFISKLAGINEKKFSINIDFEDRCAEEAHALAKGLGEFVVINAGPHYSGPNWSYHERQALADSFAKKGLNVVSLAGRDGKKLEHTVPLFDLSLQASVALIARAKCYFGQDCGTSWLACAAHNTPKRILVDKTPGRVGYDSYVDCLHDTNIMEFPLSTQMSEIEKTL